MESDVEKLGKTIIEASFRVHSALGPGLLESAYQACLMHDLKNQQLKLASEVAMPLHYMGARLDVGYRIDLLVEDLVIVELKSVEKLMPIHQAQLLGYLKLSGLRLGYLLNFNVIHMRDGIKRMVN